MWWQSPLENEHGSAKNHPIETEDHLSSTSVQARGNKDSRRNCLVPWRGVKGGWCAYRTFLLCSRFVVCTYIKIKGVCWIDRQSSFCWWLLQGTVMAKPKVYNTQPHQNRFPSKDTCGGLFLQHISKRTIICHTVDGRNLAPVDMVNFPLFTGFYTTHMVQDFFHQQ